MTELISLWYERYYARALLTCLHRSIAVPEWAKLRRGEYVPLERAMAAFDLFIPETSFGDLDEVWCGVSQSHHSGY